MLRRSLLIAGIGLLPVLGADQKTRAYEAQAAIPNAPLGDSHASDKGRVETLLSKNGYRLIGDLRRKGQLISTTAERDGLSWKLVVDTNSGNIIGRRLLMTPVSLTN